METPPLKQDPVAPKTTLQQDITHAGQRRINLIWELTQAVIALFVTFSTVSAAFIVSIGETQLNNNQMIGMMQLVGMTLLILGFYFSRTNHQAIGGVGKKENEEQKYEGR